MVARAAEVVSFWREAGPDRWFTKDAAFDEQIRERFLDTYEAAAAGKLSGWEHSARDALALLILLDQFPRNMLPSRPPRRPARGSYRRLFAASEGRWSS